MRKFLLRVLAGFLPFVIGCKDEAGTTTAEENLFELLPASQTGIYFNNEVRDSSDCNILNFRNFYNGGGVAIGDINNDGKADIFFSSNQGDNQLYLNKGNWQFEDITAKAGVKGIYKWHTGVSMVDINADGWLDIYVCNSGDVAGNSRENELYINLGNGRFRESAAEYGLADKGIGTQAAFFDYDNDGDLDCFILNNSFRPIESFGYDRRIRNIRSESGGHRLYQNDRGHFSDISEKAHIYGSEIAFGLGVSVADLNNDGWMDIYVSNDFFEKDYLYINQKDGSFREMIDDLTGHTSLASMGSDIMDINNDGWLDVFTTDMLPEGDYRLKTTSKFDDYDVQAAKLSNDFHHQLQSNCLQLNNGDGSFREIAAYAGVEATDWSWGALSFDFDNDGWKDIFVSNGISKDLTDQDFLDFFSAAETRAKAVNEGFSYKSFLEKLKSNPVSNYAFVNEKNLSFKNRSEALGLATPSFSNGAAYGDLDNDGDLDLVVNNENMPAFIYRNFSSERSLGNYLKIKFLGEGKNRFGIGCRAIVYAGGQKLVNENIPFRGFQSATEPFLTIGIGAAEKADSIIVLWPGLKSQIFYNFPAGQSLVVKELEAKPGLPVNEARHPALYRNTSETTFIGNTKHTENNFIDFDKERLIPRLISTEGPKLATADINGDGLEDIFVGNATGDTAKLFMQDRDNHFRRVPCYAFDQDRQSETIGAAFFDADADGDADLVLASGGNEYEESDLHMLVRLYINDGKGNFSRAFKGWPPISLNASCITIADVDADGLPDLFIGGRSVPGAYGTRPSSVLLKNKGNGMFTNATASMAPELYRLGMVADARWDVIDADGSYSLIVAGDWIPITIFKFIDGRLRKTSEIKGSSGWWNCLSVADLDGDGLKDLLAGNRGSNSKIRADQEHPARLFVDDFDRNGQGECIAAYYKSDEKSYPFNLKGDFVAQMPSFKKKFLYYSSYAGKTIEEVLTNDQREHALVLQVQEPRSMIYYNNEEGNFEAQSLPVEAQLSTMYAIEVTDLNGDGRPDIFMGGNLYGVKPEVGRYDASEGLSFLNLGKRKFVYLPEGESGLHTRGEIRDIRSVKTSNGQSIIVAKNNDKLQLFSKP